MWTVSVRHADLSLADPILFTRLELVENCNSPDTLALDGDIDHIRPALTVGGGIVVHDDTGTQRFSGIATDITRRGDRTATVIFTGDLVYLWDRICWPIPSVQWQDQATVRDQQTATAETRLLGFITRNAGSSAYTFRRVPHLRIPTSLNRGPSRMSSGALQNLGQIVADLAETAGLRVEIRQTYEGATPYLDVVLTELQDLTSWAQFGPAHGGGPALLDQTWNYQLTPPATVFLSVSSTDIDELGAARRYMQLQNIGGELLWNRRVEYFLDHRDLDDISEIVEAIETARAENMGTVEISAPLASSSMGVGVEVPVGALVTVVLDGVVVTDRIRQIITVVGGDGAGTATVTVTPIFGTPDAVKTPTQKQLAAALRRLRTLERSL